MMGPGRWGLRTGLQLSRAEGSAAIEKRAVEYALHGRQLLRLGPQTGKSMCK